MEETTTKSDLRDKCERLADYLEAVYEGRVYREDGEEITAESTEDVPEDAEAVSLYDVVADSYSVKYTCDMSSPDEVESCRVALAIGGPNIWADTDERGICGYWGDERVWVGLDWDLCGELASVVSEAVGCR